MERLLVLRLESAGLEAEAWLNGVPLARVGGPAGPPRVAVVPVHEFTLAGANQLELVVGPPPPGAEPAGPQPLLADGTQGASVRLLLPRIGSVCDPASVRTLAQLDLAPAADTLLMTPHTVSARVELPIAFPRWRWLDAPPWPDAAAPGATPALLAWLLEIALGLARGQPEPFLQATRLRLEECALAYQRPLADDVSRLRARIESLRGVAAPVAAMLPSAATVRLRPLAGGRLVECLHADGAPLLRTPAPGGGLIHWPLRVAQVDGRFYALR